MTKFKVGDIARIKVRKIKKFDPGESLQKAWEQRYAKPKQMTATEEEFISSAAQMKPKTIRYGEKAPKDIVAIANVFGVKTTQAKAQEFIPVTERVERIAQNIEFKVASKKLGQAQQAVKNIASKNLKRFTTKPAKIGRTLPKSDWAHEDKKLTKAILTARKATKPQSVLTKGIGVVPQPLSQRAKSYFKLTPMGLYKGKGPARTGQELQMKYEKVASRAMLHGAGAGAQFTKQVIESGKPVRKIKDIQTKFLRKKKGQVPEERAFEMGFPAKTPGGQFQPDLGELGRYKPFKDPTKRLTLGEEAAISSQQHAVYADIKTKVKPGQPVGTIKKVFAKQFGKSREQAFKMKDRYTTEFESGRRMPTKEYKAGLKDYQRKALIRLEAKIPKAYSKKTKALYPALSKDQKWFKRMESEWGKKKGRTPFDF